LSLTFLKSNNSKIVCWNIINALLTFSFISNNEVSATNSMTYSEVLYILIDNWVWKAICKVAYELLQVIS